MTKKLKVMSRYLETARTPNCRVHKNGSFKSIQLYKLGSAVRPTKLNRAIMCNYMGKL